MKSFLNIRLLQLYVLLAVFTLASCSKDKNNDRLLFSVDDDIALGNQVAAQVDSMYRANGQLVERTSSNPNAIKAYQHLDRITNTILNSGKVTFRNEFVWKVSLIHDDSTLNAFATPGGHIYVFTGLINYLDREDHFAGVMGHEIAHADRRHTSKQLQKQYGIAILLSLVLGDNPGMVAQIATGLASLRFSRDDEREADNFSVVYLGGTNVYACDGAAGFFEKLIAMNQAGQTPEFLSTHPSPDNRVQDIKNKATEEGCSTAPSPDNQFMEFKQAIANL